MPHEPNTLANPIPAAYATDYEVRLRDGVGQVMSGSEFLPMLLSTGAFRSGSAGGNVATFHTTKGLWARIRTESDAARETFDKAYNALRRPQQVITSIGADPDDPTVETRTRTLRQSIASSYRDLKRLMGGAVLGSSDFASGYRGFSCLNDIRSWSADMVARGASPLETGEAETALHALVRDAEQVRHSLDRAQSVLRQGNDAETAQLALEDIRLAAHAERRLRADRRPRELVPVVMAAIGLAQLHAELSTVNDRAARFHMDQGVSLLKWLSTGAWQLSDTGGAVRAETDAMGKAVTASLAFDSVATDLSLQQMSGAGDFDRAESVGRAKEMFGWIVEAALAGPGLVPETKAEAQGPADAGLSPG